MRLYHGGVSAVRKPSISKGRSKTDFGQGFYTTTSYEQAVRWALIKKQRAGGLAKAIVSTYNFVEPIHEALDINLYEGATLEWLTFVVANRRGTLTRLFDVVQGPVANDKLYATISLYEQGILSAEASIEQLKTHHLYGQVSFHTSKSLLQLQFVESNEV